jgi:SAM-dependent methyltransferase
LHFPSTELVGATLGYNVFVFEGTVGYSYYLSMSGNYSGFPEEGFANNQAEPQASKLDASFPAVLLGAPPDDIKAYVRHLHESDANIYKTDLDILLLGTMATQAEIELWRPADNPLENSYAKRDRYPGEQPWNGQHEGIWTSYSAARDIGRALRLSESDTFYDLGAGYGRLVLYTAITSPATCKGIEMVGERVQLVQAAIDKLALHNAEFIESKVQDVDYSDGDIFYMYSPFSGQTFDKVFDQLEAIAAEKPITVINRGLNIHYAKKRGHLQELELVRRLRPNATGIIDVFESSDIANSPFSKVHQQGEHTI